MMHNFWRDLTYAARVLRRAPGFTFIAALALAIGIGTNCATFSLVDAVMLRPLPFAQPDKLVQIWERPPGKEHNAVSPLNFRDWSEQNSVFSSMAAVSGNSKTLLTAAGAERIIGQAVTSQFFELMGVAPISGRTFGAEEAKQNDKVIVLGENIWRGRFGGDPQLVGSQLNFEGEAYTVIGIMPEKFTILWPSDFWTLFTVKSDPVLRKMHYLRVFGRLKDGVTIDQARSGMGVIAENIGRISPETNKGWGISMTPLHEAVVGEQLRTTSLVLAGVVAFVLLMVCGNLANLLLARGVGRTREIAVRAALGGSQRQIARQLLVESGLLAVLGGVIGVGLAWMIVRAAPAFLPPDILPPGVQLALDGRILAFSGALVLLTAVLFGLVPAWHGARVSLTEALTAGGRAVAGGSGALRAALAVAEIAVAVMLVAGAGLLLRTLTSLGNVEMGFRADHVLTMNLGLSDAKYPKPSQTGPFYRAVEQEVGALPGVRSVAFSTILPGEGWDIGQSFELLDSSDQKGAHYQMVSSKYFDTLGISLLSGRAFNDHDDSRSLPVCVVNEEFVREYLQGRAAVGTRIKVSSMGETGPVPVVREIVGVIKQVKVAGPTEAKEALEIYVPQAQNPWFWGVLSVKTVGDPLAMTQAVRAAIARVDKDQPVTRIRSMEEVVAETVAQPRFRAELVGAFAALALVLAAVGIFGVVAFSVNQRLREFGIRMALGANARGILGLVLRDGLRMTGLGIAIGLIGAAAVTRSIGSLLFGVTPNDPMTFLAAPAILAVVAIVACVAPAMRGAGVDPAVALRQD